MRALGQSLAALGLTALAALVGFGCGDDAPAVPPSDPPVAGASAEDPMPQLLSQTGLYVPGGLEFAPDARPYQPRAALWADGAAKQRWLFLPAGARIDTRDMDHWTFPAGTKAWKEFGMPGRKLETRLLWKRNSGWVSLAYQWNDAQTDAALAPNRGSKDVLGTAHDIPSRTGCDECHEGMPDRLLGVSAIALSHDGPGITVRSLADEGRLSDPPVSGDFRLPDDPAWNALAYLHANCGNCHSPTSLAWDRVDLDLWLRTDQLQDPHATVSYQSTVGVKLTDTGDGLSLRIAPANAEASGLLLRMKLRGDERAMPPLASETTDDDGLAVLQAWIESL